MTALALAEQSRQALEGNDQAKLQAVATAAGVWQGWLVGKIGSKPLGLALVATSVFDVALNSWIQKVQYKYKQYWWDAYKGWTTRKYPNITLGELGTRWIDVIEDERVDGTKDERTEKTRKRLHEFWKNARVNAYQIHGEEKPFVSDANAIARFKEEFAARYFNDVLKTGDYNINKRGLVEYYKIQAKITLGYARDHAVKACRALLEKRKDLEALEAAIAWARKEMTTEADPGQLREAQEALAACDMARADALIARLPMGRELKRELAARDLAAEAETAIKECRFKSAGAWIDQLPGGQKATELRQRLANGRAHEATTKSLYDSGRALLKAGKSAEAIGQFKEAKAHTHCARLATTIDAAIARAEAWARDRGLHDRAMAAIRGCRFKEAKTLIGKIGQESERTAAQAAFDQAAASEKRTNALFKEGNALYKDGKYQTALDKLGAARDNTACARYRSRIDQALATVRAAAEQSRTPAAPTAAARSICRDSLPGSVPYMQETGSFECGCADPMVINRAGNACRLGRQGQMARINCTGGRTPDWNSDAERAVSACPGKNQRWDGRRCASAVQTAPAAGGAAAGADPVADMLGNILGGMLGQVPDTPGAPNAPGTGTDRLGNILGGMLGQVPGAPGAAGGNPGGGAPGGGASSTECRRIMEDMARILREMQARGRPTSSAEDERLGRLYIQKHLRLCDRADRARCDFGNQRANNKFYTMCRNFRRGRLY